LRQAISLKVMILAFKGILHDVFHVFGYLLILRISVTDALVLVKRSIFRLAMGNLGRSRKGWGSLVVDTLNVA
jgi:hypothetical protein